MFIHCQPPATSHLRLYFSPQRKSISMCRVNSVPYYAIFMMIQGFSLAILWVRNDIPYNRNQAANQWGLNNTDMTSEVWFRPLYFSIADDLRRSCIWNLWYWIWYVPSIVLLLRSTGTSIHVSLLCLLIKIIVYIDSL